MWPDSGHPPSDELPFTFQLTCQSLVSGWTPVRLDRWTEDETPIGDITSWSGGLAVSERAVEVFNDLLGDAVELLPVDGLPGGFYLLNVVRCVAALVESGSDVFRYPSTQKIGYLSTYCLDDSAIVGEPIFKLAEWPTGQVLVNDTFRALVTDGGLRGFKMKQVWTRPSN